MGEVVLFRQYNIIWPFHRWSVYANGERIGRIRNCRSCKFHLSAGTYTLQIKCNASYLQTIYSNNLTFTIADNDVIVLDVRPHPLFFFTRSPKWFRQTESLLLLDMNDHIEAHLANIEKEKQDIINNLQNSKFHVSTWILILLSSLILIGSNIVYPDAFISHTAWALFFGIINIGWILIYGILQKSVLIQGEEYRQHILICSQMLLIICIFLKNKHNDLMMLYMLLGIVHLIAGVYLYVSKGKAKFFL